jgi:peptidyl-prolyl cis-trans isomerase C
MKDSKLSDKKLRLEFDQSPDANLVLVEVNGQTLSANELTDRVEAQMAQHAENMRPDQVAGAIAHLRTAAIRDFITTVLLEGEAIARGIVPPPGELEKAMADVASRLPPGLKLEDALGQSGLALADFKERLTKELRVRVMVDQELAKARPATEAETETFFKEQQAVLEAPETVAARHILIMSDEQDDAKTKEVKRAKIEGIRRELEGGADFEALAKAHSDCPSGKEGGSLGTFGRGQMVKAFEEAAFTQPLNKVGPVVETPFGFHLVEVTEKNAGHIRPFSECREQILEHLNKVNRHEVFTAFVNSLQAKATIKMDPSVEGELEKE